LGAVVATIAFLRVLYAVIIWVTSLVGKNGEERIGYFTTTALGIFILGTERYLINIVVGIISVALIIVLEIYLPRDTGFASPTMVFLTNFTISIVLNSGLLYGIIFY